MKIFYSLLIFTFLAIACKPAQEPVDVITEDNITAKSFGTTIDAADAIAYEELLVRIEKEDSVVTKVEGIVNSVCKAKGCWINLESAANPGKDMMFVKFKDYAFFMPKECEGQKVIMSGKAYKEETSVDELRHYAEDEGKSEEDIAAITEPVVELKFMADGVLLYPKS